MSYLDHIASANSVLLSLILKWSLTKTLSRLEPGMSSTVVA
jgi:hypothetical protein